MPIHVTKLQQGESRLIAMLVDQISDPYFADMARRIEKRAFDLGYKVIFGNTENDLLLMASLLSGFENMDVAGYIIAPPPGFSPDIKALRGKNKAVVLLDSPYSGRGVYNVSCDNFTGAYDAVKHLVTNDFRHIGLVIPEAAGQRMTERYKGYEKALADHGLDTCVGWLPISASPEKIKAAIIGLFRRNSRLDALLFAHNTLIFNGISVLRQLGKKISQDVAVVSFDDNEHLSLFSPAVTAVALPLDEMAENMLQYITAHTAGRKDNQSPKQAIVLPARLIVRLSSRQLLAGQYDLVMA